MTCNRCSSIYSIPTCVTEIVIGTISELIANVTVVFKNQTTGRTTFVGATSDGLGLVTVDMEGVSVVPGHSYDIYVVSNIDSPDERLDITINSETVDCLMTEFIHVKDESGDEIVTVSHVVKLK